MAGLAYRNDGPITLVAGEALAADRFVKLSASTAVYADAGDEPIGITMEAVASGAQVPVDLMTGAVRRVTASKALSACGAIYCAADGKASDAAVGKQIGVNLTSATGAGGVVPAIVWGPRGGNDLLTSKVSICEFVDDFFGFDGTATVAIWDDAVLDTTGAIGMTDAANGVLSIASHSDDNDEGYIGTINECWDFQVDKRLFFEARVKLTEAATDDANIIVGLSDTCAADSLLDDGAGPMASYDGALFFKVDGGTVWQSEISNAGTQDTDTDAGAFTSGSWTTLSIFYDYNDGVTAKVYFYVDGVLGATHDMTITGMAEMNILLGVKAGGAHAETLLVDFVRVVAER